MIDDRLIELLATFKFPVYRQGSLAQNAAYPDTFFTFWENPETTTAYDNDTQFVVYDFYVYIYSINPIVLAETLAEARKLLKRAGFIIISRGFDVASDEQSHSGKGFEVGYLNTEN